MRVRCRLCTLATLLWYLWCCKCTKATVPTLPSAQTLSFLITVANKTAFFHKVFLQKLQVYYKSHYHKYGSKSRIEYLTNLAPVTSYTVVIIVESLYLRTLFYTTFVIASVPCFVGTHRFFPLCCTWTIRVKLGFRIGMMS